MSSTAALPSWIVTLPALRRAACAPYAPGPWDEDATPEEHAFALEVCASCPVVAECGRMGDDGGFGGIWGGRLRKTTTGTQEMCFSGWVQGHLQPCAPAGEVWARRHGLVPCRGCVDAERRRARDAKARERFKRNEGGNWLPGHSGPCREAGYNWARTHKQPCCPGCRAEKNAASAARKRDPSRKGRARKGTCLVDWTSGHLEPHAEAGYKWAIRHRLEPCPGCRRVRVQKRRERRERKQQ